MFDSCQGQNIYLFSKNIQTGSGVHISIQYILYNNGYEDIIPNVHSKTADTGSIFYHQT